MPSPQHLLALDQGTTSSRAIAFDLRGRVIATTQREFTQHFPRPGWVEHDAEEIWQTQLAVARECIQRIGGPQTVAAIGITNQRETTVVWHRASGRPIAPAIVWQDRRTTAQCEALAPGQRALIQQRTGLVPDAYFSATKLRWLLQNIPGARQQAENGELAFGTIDSWLIWQLSGHRLHVTDPSNASRTLLMNLHTLQWDDELLRLFDIPAALLPRIVPSSGPIGPTQAELFGAPIPISGIAGDQQAATFGHGCLRPGMAKNTYGTGCFMLMNTGARPAPRTGSLLATVGWQTGPATAAGTTAETAYCLEGSVFSAGATVQWLRDGLQIIPSAAAIEELAASVPDTGDLFLVPAFTGLGAPDWDSRARAALIGLTRGASRAHIARAALEAIALQSADVFTAMSQAAGLPLTQLWVDGGASRNNLLMQMQADLLGVPVARPASAEITALGAAALAALGIGLWQDTSALAEQHASARIFEPALHEPARQARLHRWREAVERAKNWAQD